MLKWIERCNGSACTRYGDWPFTRVADIDTKGLDVSVDNLRKLLTVDQEGWKAEIPLIREFFASSATACLAALNEEVNQLENRLKQ